MPERPDLEYQVPILQRELVGRRFLSVRVRKPVVLRAVEPIEVTTGQSVVAVRRHLHFVHLQLSGTQDLVVHPMLAGRFWIGSGRETADTAVSWGMDDGRELRYRDSQQMGKIYLISRGGEAGVPGYYPAGMDVLAPEFTEAALSRLAKGRREQVKVFLMDKTILDAFGNCYADEVMWEAGLHPKTLMSSLKEEDLGRLHRAIQAVLRHANEEIAARKPALEEREREFTRVRNHGGEPCPRCGTTIRASGVHGHDAFFCPQCQPDRAGRGLVDWRQQA